MNPLFDRDKIKTRPLSDRDNQLMVERNIDPARFVPQLSSAAQAVVQTAAGEIRRARGNGRPVILAFGAHSIKNGLSPTLISLLEKGWVTHLATNGAGIIHDWEFAFQGMSGENVRRYAAEGQFGIWEQTGLYLNLAFIVGAYEGLGYGASVGAMVERDGLEIPPEKQ